MRPLVFLEELYPSTREYAQRLDVPQRPGSVDNCSLARRAERFCPRCSPSSLAEVVAFVKGQELSSFQNHVLRPSASLLLDDSVNAVSLAVAGNQMVLDLAHVPRVRLPLFYGGAHLRKGQANNITRFWVHSFSILSVSIVFYDPMVEFADEFTMHPFSVSTTDTTSFSFVVSDMTLGNITPLEGWDHLYYTFHVNINERDVYSDLFSLYL